MNAERWAKVEALFDRVADLPGSERDALLAGEPDRELAAEVARLCAAQTAGFLTDLDAPPPSLAGTRLGDFELHELIGRGGMGVVYRATQLELDRPVAVKVFDPRVPSDPLATERFKREALAASRLVHPRIVPVLAFGQANGLFYYAMQLVAGWNLRQLMDGAVAGGPDFGDPVVCARLMRDVAEALAYSHERGVLHRDIKPQNILVDRDHRPHVIDFGLAKVLHLDAISRSGHSAGTPLYMSPEQVRAEREPVDARTDVYSAGAVLHELLTGEPPFPGASVEEILHRITHEDARPLRRLRDNVPRDLELVTLKALRRDRDDRYASAAELQRDLERYLAGATVAARPPSLWYRLQRFAGRRAVTLAALAGALLALAGFAAFAGGETAAAEDADRAVTVSGTQSLAVTVSPWLGAAAGWAPPERATVERNERTFDMRSGEARIVLVDERGAFAELRRRADESAIDLAHVRFATVAEVESEMVRVDGGALEMWNLVGTPSGTQLSSAMQDCRPFLIDRAPVTIGQYRTFLQAVGRERPSSWTISGLQKIWDEPPRADWDELPMVFVEWREAREYAEWVGKRLPTAVEWDLAMGRAETWLEDHLTDGATTPFVLGRGSDQEVSHFVRHAVPADRAGTYAERGILQPFGNVREWLADPSEFKVASRTGRLATGGSWAVSAEKLFMFGFPRSSPTFDATGDLGLRCAKSLTPAPPRTATAAKPGSTDPSSTQKENR